MPGVFAVLNGKAVDRAIVSDPERARFLAGMVVWKPGELREEITNGSGTCSSPIPPSSCRKAPTGSGRSWRAARSSPRTRF